MFLLHLRISTLIQSLKKSKYGKGNIVTKLLLQYDARF